MKNTIFIVFLLIPTLIFTQSRSFKNSGIDNYKYFVVEDTGPQKNLKSIVLERLKNYNLIDINDNFPKDLEENPDLALYINLVYSSWPNYDVKFMLLKDDGEIFYEKFVPSQGSRKLALKKAIAKLAAYKHNYNPDGVKDFKPIVEKNREESWKGNGSGILISKSGHIVTNYHVIENSNKIEVEFIMDGEVNKLNAEIIQTDKVNDLAIIKIFDIKFDGLDELSYNFKAKSSDVGTRVYAFGYPMALTVMGKEIKITDGIISSKSGYDGDITTYQITAPIQGGNSGGPLFDNKGNFIGINSSGLRADVANNVGYTIKSSYVLNLIDVLPKTIELPSSDMLQSLPLTEQIKEISKYVVLVKVK